MATREAEVEGPPTDPGAGPPQERSDAPSWSDRLLPRTALGMSVLLLCAAFGAAFSGAILYAYYEYRLDTATENVDQYVGDFSKEVSRARKLIEKEREDAKTQIRNELEPLQQFAPGGETIKNLLDKTAPSVWFVETLDESGAPSVGSAFVAFSDDDQTFLLTSFTTVRAATQDPAPEITVVKGEERLGATLWTWEEGRDLALLVIDKGGTPRLEWSGLDDLGTGDRVFVVSGLGASGGAVSQGLVADVSANGVQHDAPVGVAFQGGPVVNSTGEVIAVASRHYSPLNFDPEAVFFGVPIQASCEAIVDCPDGQATAPGQQR
jgi:S1-C subfamily serine protease